MTMAPRAPVARISPAHRQRLSRLFMRMTQLARDDALTVVRRELRGVVTPGGTIRDHAIETGGDLFGDISDAEVVGIGHHPLATGTPTNHQTLVFRTSDNKLHWANGGSGGGRNEIVVTGHTDVDGNGEFIWENGDLIYEVVP